MTIQNRTHYTHHDREHVYRVPDTEMPPVEETIPEPAPSVQVDDIWDLDRRYCVRCGEVVGVPHWVKTDHLGHCPGCSWLTKKKKIRD